MDLFQECPTCAAKPGMPDLCPSCIHNRSVILRLQKQQPVGMSQVFLTPAEAQLLANAVMPKSWTELQDHVLSSLLSKLNTLIIVGK